ncbi:urease accessory protein UreF [Lacibacterium aquatile]|uniref:Urease accessory protein UreF n=1 Tax=Lacibacterium aquatile TaxID=1168082 RepID=A0ABW5DTM6_9PROT
MIAGLTRLLTWLSPAYPVGAFSYSHGIEWAVETGRVVTWQQAADYIATVLVDGAGWNDSILLAEAHRATEMGDWPAVDHLIDLGAAWRSTSETALESRQQGKAFLDITRKTWPDPALEALAGLVDGRPLAYPIALGVAAAPHLPLAVMLPAYLTAFAGNLISAAVRLVPLGQTDGQRIQASLEKKIAEVAHEASLASLDDLGSAAPLLDIASMAHETQHTRLFRS